MLGVALGFASLAGINLYLTVFATGLAVQQGWIVLAPQYQQLDVLAHPAIVTIAGILFVLEFFADKVPWVDSLWDAIHTVIRPVGGAFLAIRVLGTPEPVLDVVAALLAGGVTALVHGAKAGTRLVVNHSPEPFSNIAVSVAEDTAVIGGLALIAHNPLAALVVFTVFIAAIIYFAPKILRALRVHAWLIWKKVTAPPADDAPTDLATDLPPDTHIVFHDSNLLGEKVLWALPCASGSAKKISANLFGYLVATANAPHTLWFVAERRWRPLAVELDLRTYKIVQESKFLSENLVLYSLEKKPKYQFIFDRSCARQVKTAAASIQERLAAAALAEAPVAR